MGWAAEATIRGAAKNLRDVGSLEKRAADHASNAVATALTPAGEEMLVVSETLEHWLKQCPKGPIAIDDDHVKVAVKALAEGWNSTLMRAIANAPLTLTEISSLIPDVSYPALERRIEWMRATGQISALPREPRGTPYVPTAWLGQAISPIAVAARCERRYVEDAPPITDVEIEAAFLLTLPLVELPATAHGSCVLVSRTDPIDGGDPDLQLAGITVEVSKGQITSSTFSTDSEPNTWAIGTSDHWLEAFIDKRLENLRIGGANPQLPLELIQAIHFSTLHRSMNT